ncbi:MAG: hypothetical protein AAAFM81_06910 [Pseudomonadota bacterium]
MNLEQVTGVLKPRATWEAVDFGARLVRRDWRTIYAVWLLLMFPFALLAAALCFVVPYSGWLIVAYWWLEPIADGPVLHIISQRLFGTKVSIRDALKRALPLAWRNKIFLLPFVRLHFYRSLAMPVTQLEGLTGKARRQRMQTINRTASGHGFGLTILYHHLVLALYLGIMAFVYLMVPSDYQQAFSGELMVFIDADTPGSNAVSLLMYFVAQALLQPWFIGGGFGLYINRRTHLEAWDVEIAFRRMVNRNQREKKQSGAVVLTAFVATMMALSTGDVSAQSKNARPESAERESLPRTFSRYEAESLVDEAFSDPRFGSEITETRWRRIERAEEQEDVQDIDAVSGGWIKFGRVLSFIGEFGLWIVIAILVLILLANANKLFLARGVSRQQVSKPELSRAPPSDDEDVPLPDDIPAAVLTMLRDDPRAAVALLYRATLDRLTHQYDLRFPDSATEAECLAITRRHAPQTVVQYFSNLLLVWQRLAYANHAPQSHIVEQLVSDWSALAATEVAP